MAIRTGADYIKALRHGREIWHGGRRRAIRRAYWYCWSGRASSIISAGAAPRLILVSEPRWKAGKVNRAPADITSPKQFNFTVPVTGRAAIWKREGG